MKKSFLRASLVLLLPFLSLLSHASPGDTLKVQSFTFGSPQDAWFVFPSDTMQVNKILMYYTLKCNPAQNPACGEWDYQTSTYLYQHTGVRDSNLLNAPSYKVDGQSPDSLPLMFQPSWKYSPHFQTSIVHTSTLSFDSAYIGTGVLSAPPPFNAANPVCRSQYLWKASEFITAGMHAGDISGIKFNLVWAGSTLHNLCIRIKHTSLDSLTSQTFENSGFTTVYCNNTTFTTTGWNSLQFTTPFAWDGLSNVVFDISFDNQDAGINSSVFSHYTYQKTGITSAGSDRSLFFKGADFVKIPVGSVAMLDSAVTVAFWAYGNPDFQPQNQSIFWLSDSADRRILNCHLPWSNNNIYWDAGNSNTGSYDRINKAATTDEIEGKWNYWAFTKDVATGSLKIYLNGLLWHSGTGFTRRMYGAFEFYLGSAVDGTSNYDGSIDEFAVWNTELDSATLHQWMYKDLDATHPYHSNLKLYYKFNDDTPLSAADSSGAAHNGVLNGYPQYQLVKGAELVRNFTETSLRPTLCFEQGVYVSHIDTLVTIDSVQTDPMQVFFYSDSLHPLVCTDTLMAWPAAYDHYTYDNHGHATDSAFVAPDTTLHLKRWYYYSAPFEVINRFELQRFITPYGNGLSLGNGFTWVTDVSDYRTLLHDSVHLAAGNWQELLDLRFDFIKGIPPRDPLSVQNLWNGNFNFGYATDPIESHLTPKKVFIPDAAKSIRWKSRITGHGMDTPENCAEFCPKNHYFKVNGTQAYQRLVWRDDCGLNPVYPQGGTWIYSRANWCPGSDVKTYDLELTPFVTLNDTATLDHDVEPYIHTGNWSYYQIEDQLITYDKSNFTLDAELYDVISPSMAQIYSRKNPVCNNPVVTIRNTGSDSLTSLDIIYGVEGLATTPSVFHWQGHLGFMDMVNVTLGAINWESSNGTFYATVSSPNGGTDMYAWNNTYKTHYSAPPQFPADIYIEFKSNLYPGENSYTLKDDQGNIILQKSNFAMNTLYRDTVHLENGCYDFNLYDTDDDGLSFWANDDGSGYIRIRNAVTGQVLKTWNPDFGARAFTQFTVGYFLHQEETQAQQSIELYPNPSAGEFILDIVNPSAQDIDIQVFDHLGKLIFKLTENNLLEKKIPLDLSCKPSGIYFVNIRTGSGLLTKKIVIQK